MRSRKHIRSAAAEFEAQFDTVEPWRDNLFRLQLARRVPLPALGGRAP